MRKTMTSLTVSATPLRVDLTTTMTMPLGEFVGLIAKKIPGLGSNCFIKAS